ncbi:MAG: hypothetical protein P4M11_11120 [Candidatus Pacebacteria bacterium]|nr:hypothetical protein [Candidatus Paceibacterota bacterium]
MSSANVGTKEFLVPLSVKTSFLWRVVVAFVFPSLVTVLMYVKAFNHTDFIHESITMTNLLIRLDLVAVCCDCILRYLSLRKPHRMHFYDSSYPVFVSNTTTQMVTFYNARMATMFQAVYDVCTTSRNPR